MRYLNTKVKSVDNILFTAWFLCQILETTWTSFFQTTRIQLHMALEVAGGTRELANLQKGTSSVANSSSAVTKE